MNTSNWLDQTEPLVEDTPRQNADERPQPDEEGSDNVSRQHHENPSHPNGSGIDPNEYEINPDQPALEGFFSDIAKFFKGKPKTADLKATNDKLEEAMHDTLLSDTWLKEQTFSHERVKIKGPTILKPGNAKQATDHVVQGLEQAATKNAQLTVNWVKGIQKAIDVCQKGNFTDYTVEQLQEWTPEMENLDFDVPFVEPTEIGKTKVDLTLPALDMAGVKEVAQLLLALNTARVTYPNKSYAAVRVRFPRSGNVVFNIKDPAIKAAAKEFYDNTESAIDYYQEHFFTDQFLYFDNVAVLSDALLHWIAKSVTGVNVTPSSEGFFDAITSLFKSKPKDTNLEVNGNALDKALKESILNESWLSSQKFVEGDVTFDAPSILKGGDAKKAVSDVVRVLDVAAAQNANRANLWYRQHRDLIDIGVDGTYGNYSADQLHQFADDIESVEIERTTIEPARITEKTESLTLPALDKAGIKAIAQCLLDLSMARNEYGRNSFGDLPRGADVELPNGIDDEDVEAAAQTFCGNLEDTLDYYVESFFQHQSVFHYLTLDLSRALIKWIEKSVPGVKLSAANEAFMTISNEGIVEGIRQFFGLHNRGGDYVELEGKTGQALQNLTTQLARTYGNTDWLSKQSPVKGTVKADDLSKSVDLSNIQGSLDAAASINMQINNAYTEAVRKVYAMLKPGLDLIGSECNLTDEAFETLKQLVAEAKPASELYKGPASVKPLGSESGDAVEALSTDKMPELAKAAIKHLQEIGNRQLDHLESVSSVSKALSGDFLQLTYYGAHASDAEDFELRNNKSKYNKEAWLALGGSIQRKVAQASVPAVKATNDQLNAALSAAVVYMERSLAGSSVSE